MKTKKIRTVKILTLACCLYSSFCSADDSVIGSITDVLGFFGGPITAIDSLDNVIKSINADIDSHNYENHHHNAAIDEGSSPQLSREECIMMKDKCSDKQIEQIMGKTKIEVLESNLKTMNSFGSVLTVVPEFFEMIALEDEAPDDTTNKLVNQCRNLNYPRAWVNPGNSVGKIKQCSLEMLGDIKDMTQRRSDSLNQVVDELKEITYFMRGRKSSLDAEYFNYSRNLQTALGYKNQHNPNNLMSNIRYYFQRISKLSGQLSDTAWVPLGGLFWDRAGRRREISSLREDIKDAEWKIRDHYYYARQVARLQHEVARVEQQLTLVNKNLGLIHLLDNNLVRQTAFWRKVSLSYKEIEKKAIESVGDLIDEKAYNLKADIAGIFGEFQKLEVYLNEEFSYVIGELGFLQLTREKCMMMKDKCSDKQIEQIMEKYKIKLLESNLKTINAFRNTLSMVPEFFEMIILEEEVPNDTANKLINQCRNLNYPRDFVNPSDSVKKNQTVFFGDACSYHEYDTKTLIGEQEPGVN